MFYILLKKKRDLVRAMYITYSNSEVIIHESGVTLFPSSNRYLTFERIVEIYKEVELCTKLKAKGPKIEYISYKARGLNPEGWAVYMSVDRRILFNADKKLSGTAEDQLLRHEIVHHLLSQNGMNEISRTHKSPFLVVVGQV